MHPFGTPIGGIDALLLDLDGVIVSRGRVIPGSAEAVARLRGLRIPFRIATNTSLIGRATLAAFLERSGVPIAPEELVTATSATAAYTARHFAGKPLHVIASEDARRELDGQWLVSADEVRAGAEAAAVVVGDASHTLTLADLDVAFRLVRGGAKLIAMQRNPWWNSPEGPTLDAGAVVAALEYATGRRALLIGKPARPFFRAAAAAALGETGTEPGWSRVLMVGDDLQSDVFGAQRAGLKGALVLTGKHGMAEVERAASRAAARRPDAIFESLAALVDALS
jgi:HAD superfamily hydrolase (TIGR01458 family)